MTAIYYTVIVGYALFYFVNSFKDPMPWMEKPKCDVEQIMTPVSFYMSNFLGYLDEDENCQTFESTLKSYVQVPVLVCTIVTWLIVFLCLFKGIRPLSYIVYPTFWIPAIMVVVFMIYGCTLKNA